MGEARAAGRVVVVAGEAGIGKTALVTRCPRAAPARRVLWGACDPLITPRPLGPLRDVARDAGGRLLAASIGRGSREHVLDAALDELADAAVLVIEDLHWADDATLDLVALLGRRLRALARLPGAHLPQRGARERRGAARPRRAPARVRAADRAGALSSETPSRAWRARAGRDAGDAARGHRRQPVLRHRGARRARGRGSPPACATRSPPASARLGDARARSSSWPRSCPGATELLAGRRRSAPAPRDRRLHRGRAAALPRRDARLPARPRPARGRGRHPARPAPRARPRRAGRARGGRGRRPRAARPPRAARGRPRGDPPGGARRRARAARRGAAGHRRRSSTGRRPSPRTSGRAPDRAGRSRASRSRRICAARPERAVEARRALLALHEAAGDALRAGDDLRWLARDPVVARAAGAEAAAVGDRAIAVLEAFPDRRELAMALSGRASSRCSPGAARRRSSSASGPSRSPAASATTRPSRTRSRTSAPVLGGKRARAGVRAPRGGVRLGGGSGARRPRGPRAGEPRDRHAHPPARRPAGGRREWNARWRFTQERELDGYVQYMIGVRANLRLLRGDWAGAEADASAALELSERPRRQPLPGAHRPRAPAARRAASAAGAHARGGMGASRWPPRSSSGSRRPPRRARSTRGSTAT